MGAKLTGRLRDDDRLRKTEQIVEKTLSDIEAGAKRRARVDTGAMRAGLQARKTGRFEGVVEGLVEHTIYNEFGTRDMSAQPMLTPAAEAAREPFYAALRKVWD